MTKTRRGARTPRFRRPSITASEAARALLTSHGLSEKDGIGAWWLGHYAEIDSGCGEQGEVLVSVKKEIEVLIAEYETTLAEAQAPDSLVAKISGFCSRLVSLQQQIPQKLEAELKPRFDTVLSRLRGLQSEILSAVARCAPLDFVLLRYRDQGFDPVGNGVSIGAAPNLIPEWLDLQFAIQRALHWHNRSRLAPTVPEPLVEVRVVPNGNYGGHRGPEVLKRCIIADRAEYWKIVGESPILLVSVKALRSAPHTLIPIDKEKARAAMEELDAMEKRRRGGGKRGPDRNVALEYLFRLIEMEQERGGARCGPECGGHHVAPVLAALIFLSGIEDTGSFHSFKKSVQVAYGRLQAARQVTARNSGQPIDSRRT